MGGCGLSAHDGFGHDMKILEHIITEAVANDMDHSRVGVP